MKQISIRILISIILFTFLPLAASCAENTDIMEENYSSKIYITAGNRQLTASLVDNVSTRELLELLSKGSITIKMNDYGNMEKVGQLPKALTPDDKYFATSPGDIILYQSQSLAIYYDNNAYRFTHIGRLDGDWTRATLLEALGGPGEISVTLSLKATTGINTITNDHTRSTVHRIDGTRVESADPATLPPGIYIIDGVKTMVTGK